MKPIKTLVNEWPFGDPGPSLLVKKLRTSAFPLTNNQIFVVLEAIETTCPRCWNTDISGGQVCHCVGEWFGAVINSEAICNCDNCGDSPHVEIDCSLRCCVCGADNDNYPQRIIDEAKQVYGED